MAEATKLPTPVLRIDTQSTPQRTHGLQSSFSALVTPTSATSPIFPVPLTPKDSVQASPLAHLAKLASFQSTSHAKDESRKLLRLILDQLRDRPTVPPVFEPTVGTQTGVRGETGIGQFFGLVKNTVRSKPLRQDSLVRPPPSINEDSDDDSADAFSTGSTYELMVQLKEVLLFSISQGWKLFEAR